MLHFALSRRVSARAICICCSWCGSQSEAAWTVIHRNSRRPIAVSEVCYGSDSVAIPIGAEVCMRSSICSLSGTADNMAAKMDKLLFRSSDLCKSNFHATVAWSSNGHRRNVSVLQNWMHSTQALAAGLSRSVGAAAKNMSSEKLSYFKQIAHFCHV